MSAHQQGVSTNMTKKKILYVATVDIHIKSFHLPYLKMMHDKGWEVHVATNGREKFPYCDKKHTICMERSPFKPNNLKAIKQMKELLKKEHFDIIHCHTPMGSVVTRIAAKEARKNGTRVIYTAHGFHFYTGAPLINWLLFYPVEKYLAKYTDTLITINKEDYNRAKKKFSKRCHDIQYVPGVGIDPKKFDFKMTAKEKHDLRASLGLKDDDFVMIYPARLDKNKNQGFLIKCMSELVESNSKIHLLLPGPDELNGKYQRLAKKLEVETNVHFLGYRNDIPKLLKISNIAVSSSRREGLPINIIESSIIHMPIVATRCRGISDILDKYENSYIASNNIDFIKKIKQLSNTNPTKIIIQENKKFYITTIIKIVSNIYLKEKRVLFIHGAAWMGKDEKGNYYNGPQYNSTVWNRYLTLSNNLVVMLRCDTGPISKKRALEIGIPSDTRVNYLPIKKPNRKHPISFLRTTLDNKRTIKEQVKKTDVLIARVPSVESCFAIKIAKKLNKTIITEVVGCAFDASWNYNFLGKIIALPLFIIQRNAIKKSTGTIYVTDSFLQNRYPTKTKHIACSDVQIIISKIDEKKGKRLAKKLLEKQLVTIGTIGNVDVKYKGHEYAIKALSRLKKENLINFEYQLVGGGGGKRIKKIANKENLGENIKILGKKSHEDAIEWLKQIDIYLQPSTTEGLCRSLIEAMSCGCYCIASNAGGNVELLNSQFIFKSKQPVSLYKVMKKIDENRIEKQMHQNERIIKYHFQQDELEQKRIEFMRSLTE